jgi:ribonuclease BN (tRNA processing enzyme)
MKTHGWVCAWHNPVSIVRITAAFCFPVLVCAQTGIKEAPTSQTAAIVLGVGSPDIDAARSGTSIGICAGHTLYLFDAGAGVERRLFEAAPQLKARNVDRLGPVFITHLHADHTLGLPALYFYHGIDQGTGELYARGSGTLAVYGPKQAKEHPGIVQVIESVRAAFDVPDTLANAGPGVRRNDEHFEDVLAYRPSVIPTEITPGVIYKDQNITVTAFDVDHKSPIAFGFRVQTPDRVIVISGDTRPSNAVVEACNGCDILFHEVFGYRFGPEGPSGVAQGHTSAEELGQVANRARPKHLVIYHDVDVQHDMATEIIKKAFDGEITFAKDLDIF